MVLGIGALLGIDRVGTFLRFGAVVSLVGGGRSFGRGLVRVVVAHALGYGDGGDVGVNLQLVECVQDCVDDRGAFLFRVDEQGHGQGGVDVPALGFEPAGSGAVAHALAGFGQVFLVVGEDREEKASG